MKTKEELQKLFENGDKPTQEDFWEWQNSYFHKNDKIPVDQVDYDFSKKADLVNGQVPSYQLNNMISNETLQSATDKGNTTDKQLILNGSILEYNPELGSHRFGGNLKSNAIGSKSVIYGDLALSSNISGFNNTAIGYNVLNANTTGHRNTAIGIWAGELITTGWNNTLLGNSSGARLTSGYDNIIIGRTSGYGIVTGNNNITIGNNTGQFSDRIKSNNVIIGSISGGVEQISNKLVIHNENIPASTSNPSGNPYSRNWNYALIYGDFVEKWLILDSSLKVNRLPEADLSFTKNLIAKPDGTFGWEDKIEELPLSGTLVDKPISGKIEFSSTASIESGDAIMKMDDGYISFKSGLSTSLTISKDQVFLRQGTERYINLSNELGKIVIGSTGSGVDGANYYGDDYVENSFVQKKYIDNKLSYSDQEHLTGGKWVDGKPIYKKTIKFENIPSHGEIRLSEDFKDLDKIVSNQMFTEWYAMDVAFAGNQYRNEVCITLQPDIAKIEFMAKESYDYSLIDSFTLTLEYTKKID